MPLREYLRHLREAIDRFDDYGFAETIDIREEVRAGKQAIIKVEVVYVDGSSLKIREYLDAKYRIERVSYAYQYQDKNNVLIFRYDNAPHRPSLGFMEHKHTSSGDAVRAELPDADDLVDEILEYIKTV